MSICTIFSLVVLAIFHVVKSSTFCKGSSNVQVMVIDSFLEQNVEMVCHFSLDCSNVYWKRHTDTESVVDLTPEICNIHGSQCSVRTNLAMGTSIFSMSNISASLGGRYSCHCTKPVENSSLLTASTEGCYSLSTSILHCKMQVEIPGKRKIAYEGTHLMEEIHIVDVTINDALSVKCLEGGSKNTNCSELENPHYDIPLRLSDTWCEFSCAIVIDNVTCKLQIILNVTEDVHRLPILRQESTELTRSTSDEIPTEMSTGEEEIKGTTTSIISTTSLETVTPILREITYVSTSLPVNANMSVTTGDSHSQEDRVVTKNIQTKWMKDKMIFIMVAVVVLFMFFAVLPWIYIIFLKRKDHAVYHLRDNWQNPVYDSVDNLVERSYARDNSRTLLSLTTSCDCGIVAPEESKSVNACSCDRERCHENYCSNFKQFHSEHQTNENETDETKTGVKTTIRESMCPTKNDISNCEEETRGGMQRMNNIHTYEFI